MARRIVAPKSWEAAGSRDVSVAKRPVNHFQCLLESLLEPREADKRPRSQPRSARPIGMDNNVRAPSRARGPGTAGEHDAHRLLDLAAQSEISFRQGKRVKTWLKHGRLPIGKRS